MIARRVVSWSELAVIAACGSSCGGRKADSDYHVGRADPSPGGATSTAIPTGNADTSLGGRGASASRANASTRGGANQDAFSAVGGWAIRTDSGSGGQTNFSNASRASGGTAMTSTSSSTTGGCGLLLDDMEAQTGFICEGDGRRGAWYAYNDENEDSTTQWPERTTVPGTPIAVSESDRTTNGHAIRTYGNSYWWAGVGFDLDFDGTTYRTFDASNYDGVTFWAKGSAFELRIGTVATTLVKYGGTCLDEVCDYFPHSVQIPESAQWTQHTVLFNELESWKDPGKFERDKLTNIQFEYRYGGQFDYAIDDVSFHVRPECCQGPLPRCDTLPFKDTALEQSLRGYAARANGPLRCKDVCEAPEISVARDLRTLEGIDCLPQLKRITVSDSALDSISPLSKLVRLEALTLTRDGIVDISALGALSELRELKLDGNQIVDLRPLASLGKLEKLSLNNNRISAMGPLSSLVKLTELRLESNAVTEISALSSLVQLTTLSLKGNSVVDLTPLSNLKKLEQLDLTLGNAEEITLPGGLDSLTNLTIQGGSAQRLVITGGLTNLQAITLSNCKIGELVIGSELRGLERLLLSGNGLQQVTFKGGLGRVQTLDLSSNQLESLALPEGFTALSSLSVNNNQLRQLTLARGFTALYSLNLSQNQLSTLDLPMDLKTLYHLEATGNQLTELPLNTGMTALTELKLEGNQITSVSVPQGLTHLGYVVLSNNQIDDVAGLTGQVALTSLDLSDNEITDLAPLAEAELPVDEGWLWVTGNPFECSTQRENLRSIAQRNVHVQADEGCQF